MSHLNVFIKKFFPWLALLSCILLSCISQQYNLSSGLWFPVNRLYSDYNCSNTIAVLRACMQPNPPKPAKTGLKR